MNFDQARAAVLAAAEVTPQTVTLAKAHFVAHFQRDTKMLIDNFVAAMDARPPKHVVVNPTVDSEPLIRQAGRYLAHSAAAVEAVWGLIHSGVLLPVAENMDHGYPSIGYTSIVGNSGGYEGGWQFEEFLYAVPSRVLLAPSSRARPADGTILQTTSPVRVRYTRPIAQLPTGLSVLSSGCDGVSTDRLVIPRRPGVSRPSCHASSSITSDRGLHDEKRCDIGRRAAGDSWTSFAGRRQ